MNKNLTEKEIDKLVIAQANDDDAWEKPIRVNREKMFSLVSPIAVDKEVLGGTPVFRGTRVPISALLDNISAGLTLNEFLENFPTVTRGQALQVLDYFKQTVLQHDKAA